MTTTISPDSRWTRRRSEKQRRLELVRSLADGVVLPTDNIVAALEALILPGDRVVLEGNNQKQADFLSHTLAKADPAKLHDMHMIMPSVGRSEHLDLIVRKLDFSFAGTQSLRISQLLEDGLLEIGAIHTYIELYARLVVDLIPSVVLSAGFMADRADNIYTGPSTEDTPALIEPAAFSDGIVIVQVNQLVDDVSDLLRVDIPASGVDFVVVADQPFYIEPLFTRDPRHIKPVHVLMAMMAIRGIYEKHNVQSLNHVRVMNVSSRTSARSTSARWANFESAGVARKMSSENSGICLQSGLLTLSSKDTRIASTSMFLSLYSRSKFEPRIRSMLSSLRRIFRPMINCRTVFTVSEYNEPSLKRSAENPAASRVRRTVSTTS